MLSTEQPSAYRHIEEMPVSDIIRHINEEDKTVAIAVEKALPQIGQLITAISDKMLAGGKLFYIGAGTSGRLGILDASECPPTYGVPYDLVQGIIAGGFNAIIRAAEFAEDDTKQGWLDLQSKHISFKDFVVGIAASGTTPYVISALEECKKNNIGTGCIACNAGSSLAAVADYPVEVVTGPEFITGSTRMKAGTAQKMVLNIISTTVMIQLGRVEDNSMVNMQLNNKKLIDRGVKMLMEQAKLTDYKKAKTILLEFGSVKKAAESVQKT
jgi:N-acetylmuramic acid 6-phosphate etherase